MRKEYSSPVMRCETLEVGAFGDYGTEGGDDNTGSGSLSLKYKVIFPSSSSYETSESIFFFFDLFLFLDNKSESNTCV